MGLFTEKLPFWGCKSHWTYPVRSILSVVFRIKKIDIFDEVLYFLCSYCYDNSLFFILSFHLLQINFCNYLCFYRLHNNLSLYLVSSLCFFDNKLCSSFFMYNKKNYKTPILSIKLELFIMIIASPKVNSPKVNSTSTFFNISNSKIVKTNSFLH